MRIPLPLESWTGLAGTPVPSAAMSPSGDVLVYVTQDASGTSVLKLRQLDQLEAVTLVGTEGAEMPFFSFDGDWVGYIDDGIMKRVPLRGGDPSIVTTLQSDPWGASWGADGNIIFAEIAAGLNSVPASGGKSTPLTELDASRSEYSHRLPHHVVGHDVLLFTVNVDKHGFGLSI